MAFLLDTNVLSELRRPRPEIKVVEFVAKQELSELFISTVTLAELRFGIELVSDAQRRSALNGWLDVTVRPMFAGRVLPISEEVMLMWRQLVEEGRKAGHTFAQPDLIIAATALVAGLTIVTRDRSTYERARVSLVDPWA